MSMRESFTLKYTGNQLHPSTQNEMSVQVYQLWTMSFDRRGQSVV